MVVRDRSALIVEDDTLFGSLVATMLSHAGFTTHHVEGVSEARAVMRTYDPDVAILDINLGEGPSGIQLGHSLSLTHPGMGIVLLTRYPDLQASGIKPESLPPGCAVVGKERLKDSSELLTAIESVLSSTAVPIRHDHALTSAFAHLTSNQIETLKLVAAGWTNAAIAESKGITPRSVERTLQMLARALGVETGSELNTRIELTRRHILHTGLFSAP